MVPSPRTAPTSSLIASNQSSTLETGFTVSAGNSIVNPYSDQPEALLIEGMILGITNASGMISVDARTSLDRCCTLDGASRCLTLQKMQPDERRPVYYLGTFETGTKDNNPIARVDVEEGRINFGSMKEAFEWIDRGGNKPFHYIYTSSGLLAGWYKTALPQAAGTLVKIQLWQLYLNGEKPEMLFGSQNDNFKFTRRAIDSSRISPALRQRWAEQAAGNRAANSPEKATALWQDYCVEGKDENGEYVSLAADKEEIAIALKEHKYDRRAEAIGLSLLQSRLEGLIRDKDAINKRNKLPVKDPAKVHVSFDQEAYYVPDDIAEWVPKRKHVILTQKWFRHQDIEYLYLITGFEGKAFYSKDGAVDDIMYRTEGLYLFVSNRQGMVIGGEKIDILKIENGALIVGVRNDGYEGSNGKVISFDGSKSTLICNWGFGL